MIKENDVINVTGVDYTSEGIGLAKIDGFPIFINNLIIGEEADIKITKVNRNYALGKIVSFTKKSEHRIAPLINESRNLGGCQFFQLDYTKEIEYKKSKVERALRVIGGVSRTVDVIYPSPTDKFYRNKTTLPLAKNRNGQVYYGMYKHNTHEIIAMKKTPFDDLLASEVMEKIAILLTKYNFSIYEEQNRSGQIRKVMIKTSHYLNELMVVIITKHSSVNNLDAFCSELLKACPNITTIIQNINGEVTNVNLGDKEKTLYGPGYIREKINGLIFNISSLSFFQVNTPQAEKLYTRAISLLDVGKDDVILDAYCGTGTLSLLVAQKAKEVIGVEIVKQAIEDAMINKQQNNINNVHFVVDDAGNYLVNNIKAIDKVIVDPPRKGLSDVFVNALLKVLPKKIAYISCDPATLSRDLKILSTKYDIKNIEAFDMFPRTSHVETITLLSLKTA